MQSALKVLFAPLMLLGFNGVALWLIATRHSPYWLLPLFALAIGFATLIERAIPYQHAWNQTPGEGVRDAIHAGVNILLIVLLTIMIRPGRSVWPFEWPMWAQLLVAMIVADAGITAAHIASHRVRFLWPFHIAHHAPQRMYGFNGLIQHPVHQTIEQLSAGTILIIMGMPHEVGLLLAFTVAVQLLMQHSNADMQLGPFNWFLSVAPAHRRHHAKEYAKDGVNFGLFTIVWDHVLGTADVGEEPWPGQDGIGIEGLAANYPQDYWGQMKKPFDELRRPSGQPAGEPAGEAAL